jgi:hypothetical protein
VEWDLMMIGLRGAIERYRASVGSGTGWASRAAVGEALWWISSIDEFLSRADAASKGRKERHYRMLGSTRQGRLIGGLAFVRNRANHQLVSALVEHHVAQAVGPDGTVPHVVHPDGHTEPLIITASVTRNMRPWLPRPDSGLHFCSLAQLPPADPGFSESFGRAQMYDEEVGLRDVDAVLPVALESLSMTISLTWEENGRALNQRVVIAPTGGAAG